MASNAAIGSAHGMRALRVYLEMIKFEHSVFVLPFAMIGMMWGSRFAGGSGWPGLRAFTLIVVAMVSVRSAAMAYNRIADRDIDALNPRTRVRAIPSGLLALRQVNLFFLASCVIFLAAAALLNWLTLILSPVALALLIFYSHTKRFTPLCHFVLGLSMGIGPSAGWIAVTGRLSLAPIALTLGVLFWGAGFDILYALQDEQFDRENGLRSLPETLGRKRSLAVSRACHVLCVGFLVLGGLLFHAGALFFAGVAVVATLLAYEQSLVKPDDLSKVNMAFFTMNGFVSILLFAFTLADLVARSRP